jgi:hypothetical protein
VPGRRISPSARAQTPQLPHMIAAGEDLPARQWMPSRIPARDALAAKFAASVHVPADRPPKAHESRWYPEPDR